MKKLTRFNHIVYVVAAFVAALVFFLRIYYNTNFNEPLHILTSGFEEESLFAVWKYVHGEAIYKDFHQLPFAASYFNWGFYQFYGGLTKVALHLFGAGDESIPQIGRMITLTGCVAGYVLSLKIARLVTGTATLNLPQHTLLLFFFFGYLMGFWAITVRPDVWALTFELLGLYWFLKAAGSNKLEEIILSLLFFYLAWSFKQNFAGIIGGCGLWALINKRWKQAIVLGAGFFSLVLFTYFIGSDDYRYLILESQNKMGYSLSIGLNNLKLAFVKALPITLLSLVITALVIGKYSIATVIKKVMASQHMAILTLSFIVSFVFFALMSTKGGAADNYFFTPVSVLTLLSIIVVGRLQINQRLQRNIYTAYSLICIVYAGFGMMILTNRFGQLNLKPASAKYNQLIPVMNLHDKPLLVAGDNYANLPWINKSPQHFVLATTYYYKDKYGDKFEYDGVEGLMKKGYFATLITSTSKQTEHQLLYKLTDSTFQGGQQFYVWQKK